MFVHSHVPNVLIIARDAVLSACLVTLVDVLRVGTSSRLLWGEGDLLWLFLVTMGINLAVVMGINLIACRWVRSPFWLGLVALGALYGGEWWFRAAPPHLPHPVWRGALWGPMLGLLVVGVWFRLLRWPWVRRLSLGALVPGVLVGVLSARSPHSSVEAPNATAPNVLLVSLDTVRADHIGAYGNTTIQTPVLDKLAATGVLFERAYAPIAVTGPSHASMLTGAGPWRTQMLLNGVELPEQWPTMATQLRQQGYATGAFVSAYVLDGGLGFERGFQVYDSSFSTPRGLALTGPGRWLAMVDRQLSPHAVLERAGEETVDQALEWLGAVDGAPFFAWVHLFDAHGPYQPAPPWDTAYYSGDPRSQRHTSMADVSGVAPYLLESLEGIRDVAWVRAQYAGEISAIDVQLGRLLSQLERRGLDENTIVMVVGDHGESLGENGVWFNHGGDLDASGLAVPMIMRWPGKVPAGLRVKAPVGVIDVAPTLMAMLGVSFDAPDGLDLAPSLEGTPLERDGVASICYDRERNVEEREAGRIDRPTYLLGRVSTGAGFIEIGTHTRRGAVVRGTVSEAATQRCAQMLQALNPAIHERAEHRSERTLEHLKALGYVE